MSFLWYGKSVQYHPSMMIPQFNPRGVHISVCIICFVVRKIVPENRSWMAPPQPQSTASVITGS